MCDCDSHCRSSLLLGNNGWVWYMYSVPPAGYVQVTLARHTTPKDSLISAVPISVQLLHSLSICSSYPLLAPQPRRDGKSSHHHCNHHHPRNEHRRAGSEKNQDQDQDQEQRRGFSSLVRTTEKLGWASHSTPQATGTLFGSANSKPEPTSVPRLAAGCLLAPPLRHTGTVVEKFRTWPFYPGLRFFASWVEGGAYASSWEGHSFASGQKASSYGMGTLPRFSLLLFL